jgi:hypothetical protein
VVGHRGTFHIRLLNPSATPAPVEVEVREAENTLPIDTGSLAPVIVPARGMAGPITVEVMPKVQGPVSGANSYPSQSRFQAPIRADTITPDVVPWADFM